jgi:hypothetical protein
LGLPVGSSANQRREEKAFVERLARLGFTGPDFAELAREALRRKFGGGGDVLLEGMDRSTLEEPEVFAAEMNRRFGPGAKQFCVSIVGLAESGLFHPSQPSGLESLIYPMVPSIEGRRLLALHNHRIKDEEGNYAEPSG